MRGVGWIHRPTKSWVLGFISFSDFQAQHWLLKYLKCFFIFKEKFLKIYFQSKIPSVHRVHPKYSSLQTGWNGSLLLTYGERLNAAMKCLWHRRTSVILRLHAPSKYWHFFQENLPDITLTFHSSWFWVFAQTHRDISFSKMFILFCSIPMQ